MEKKAIRVAYGEAIVKLGAENDKVVVLDADLAAATMTNGFKKAYPDRFIDCGIAEANMVDMAAGMSTMGLIPFCSTFAVFAGRSYDQIRNGVCYPKFNVKFGFSHAGITLGEDGGFYNVNADMVAGHIAAAIGAHKVVFLTDVDGLYENFENKDSLISNLTLFEAQYMVENNIVSTGMIPKLKSCIHALDSGVFRAHIINGITPHSLLLELLTSTGVGTTMHSTEESCTFDTHPLGNFASKLLENRQHAASATPNNKIF